MPWNDIESKSKPQIEKLSKEHKAKLVELDKKFYRAFTSDDGKVVLDHLVNTFIMTNETQLDAKNIEYEAGYHAGEAGLVKYILKRISNATEG